MKYAKIDREAGVVGVPSMRTSGLLKGTAIAVLGVIMCTGSAVAAEVTLRMKGGDFSVSGELKAFDGAKYTIISKSFGSMSLDAARFDCEGSSCPRPGGTITTALTAPTAGAPSGTVSLVGSNTIGGQLMPALIQAYAQANGLKTTRVAGATPEELGLKLIDSKGVEVGTVDLKRHGSGTAFKAFEKKAVDIGMSSRPIKPEEVQKLAALGLGDMKAPSNEHVLGLDGLAVYVAQESPAVSLSIDQIARIFAGQVVDWSEVGLPAGRIQVYSPSANNGTMDTFDELVLKPRGLKLTETAKRFESHAEQSDSVAADKLGIGFASIAYQRNSKALNIETSCGLITRPSTFLMKTEEYPLARRLFLYTAGQPTNPLARGLLSFALSPAAQPVVRQNDFIDQSPETLDFQSQTTRIAYALNAAGADFDLNLMKTLISDFKPAQRLTSTFRFETASFALDNKALADVTRLRSLLEKPEYKGRTVMIAGFADGIGRFDTNLVLSQRRAATVLAAIQRAGQNPIQAQLVTKGYSQLAPVACNDTAEARSYNRRVEVWVK